MKVPLDQIGEKEMFEMFPLALHEPLRGLLKKEGTTHIVVFVDLSVTSAPLWPAAMAVGPGNTYKTLEEVKDQHLGETPSSFRYARYYVEVCNE